MQAVVVLQLFAVWEPARRHLARVALLSVDLVTPFVLRMSPLMPCVVAVLMGCCCCLRASHRQHWEAPGGASRALLYKPDNSAAFRIRSNSAIFCCPQQPISTYPDRCRLRPGPEERPTQVLFPRNSLDSLNMPVAALSDEESGVTGGGKTADETQLISPIVRNVAGSTASGSSR